MDIASRISKGLAEAVIVAEVNGLVWDIDRPIETDCTLALLKWDSDKAKEVFWHSSSHILGQALERQFGGHLCYGPPLQEGFYYDVWLEDDRRVTGEDFSKLDALIKCIVKDKQPFERLELSKQDLLQLFKYNQFKVLLL